MLKQTVRCVLGLLGLVGLIACGQFPEPSAEQPRLSEWVASRYEAELRAAEIVKINSYSDQFEKPIYVELRDNVPIYFPYPKGRQLVVFVVEMRGGKPVVKHDGFTEAAFGQITGSMASVIEDAIRRARTHNQARDLERSTG